jgi:hypothetical protein
MPMSIKVSKSDAAPHSEGDGYMEAGSLPRKLLVQEGRTAATKGLLHDFSNVMVGLCSLSENALDETEPGSPLHDDMEIIRDSAVRAHQLIRRIVTLNNIEEDEATLIELGVWLDNEAETLRATLPKGSEVNIHDGGKTTLLHIRETQLRDFILMITASVARSRRNRLTLEMDINSSGDDCILKSTFSDSQPGHFTNTPPGERMLNNMLMSAMAKAMGGSCKSNYCAAGSLHVTLHLPKG